LHGSFSVPAASVGTDPEPETGNYFVSTYPPFSCWTPQAVPAFRRALAKSPDPDTSRDLGLYVHIPFCVERCAYCYYLTHDNRFRDMTSYLDALTAEWRRYRQTPALAERRLSFVYFGGGTPSVLPLARLQTLVDTLQQTASWTSAREVTFECAPRSVTEDKVRFLRDAGVTRLSLGVQDMDDEVLEANGRVHFVQDVERASAIIRRARFDIVNLDLIAGLVGQTDDSFFRSLDRVIGLGPESVTIYQLEIPRNTRLFREIADGMVTEPPAGWKTKHARLAEALSVLERAGYQVRSAYSAVRDPERHPFVYQDAQYRGADLVGIGVSAFSYFDGVDQQNVATLDAYLDAGCRDVFPHWRGYQLSDEERMIREFVLQLKLGRIDRAHFLGKFGIDPQDRFAAPLAEGRRHGWFDLDELGVTVTRQGLLRIDRLLPAFYRPAHQGVRYS